MELGIFAKTFARPSLEATLDAVKQHGIRHVQFNMACANLPSMPDAIPEEMSTSIQQACAARDIVIDAVSGTFNMCHPDGFERERGLARLGVLAATCKGLGTKVITLCTGSRNSANMWSSHPENDSRFAWRTLIDTMSAAVAIADAHDVILAFEPEVSNIVNSARKARALLDEMQSRRLKVVMDGANLFPLGALPRMKEILVEAFDLLGDSIVLAHAKDISKDGEAGHEAAGLGTLDYDLYIELLQKSGYTGPLIMHSLSEEQVPDSIAFLTEKLNRHALL